MVLIALFCFESLQEKTSEIDYLKLDINILKVEKQQQQAKVTELRSALKSSIQHHKVRQHLLLSGMNAKRLYLLSLFNSTLKPCHSLSHKAHKLYEPTDSLQFYHKAKFNQTLQKSSFHDPLQKCHWRHRDRPNNNNKMAHFLICS